MRTARNAFAALLCLLLATAAHGETVRVAAAADLAFAMQDVIRVWQQKGGGDIRLSLGSSGNVYHQIMHGAPFDLFFSADAVYIERLDANKICRRAAYASGRIVWFVPMASPLSASLALSELPESLRQHADWKIAIANPQHAPYGRAAQQALQHAGVWKFVKTHLIYGENAAQAAQFTISGSAAGGLIPLSIASSQRFQSRGHYRLIAATAHAPLRQEMALLSCDNTEAGRFFDFFRSPAVRAMLATYGFRQAKQP